MVSMHSLRNILYGKMTNQSFSSNFVSDNVHNNIRIFLDDNMYTIKLIWHASKFY